MTRDMTAPIPALPIRIHKTVCGFALAEDGSAYCGQPSAYTFRMTDWPSWRVGNTCPEHALVVRRWSGVESMRSLAVPA